MANLSRTKKYQDLRDRLQNESSVDNFSTTDLSRFEKRLNDLDAQNFSLPDSYMSDTHNATHARNHEVKEEKENPFVGNPDFDTSSYYTNQNESTFDNDYLDRYIREVKQYNIDQGNAALENTQLNILKQIERNNHPTPSTPYARQEEPHSETTDIPVFTSKTSKLQPVDMDDNFQRQPVQEDEAGEVVPTQILSKEDIMAEVQNLVNGDKPPLPQDSIEQPQQTTYSNASPFVDDLFDKNMSTDTFNRRMEIERTTRQQLLNETTQMRAQLDDYEDNLSEVSDKMRQTNKILNIVLMILILFLAVVVGFVIYWIIISK